MNQCRSITLATGLTLLALACAAQEDEGPDVYTYASYFYCAAASLTRVDAIIASDAGRMHQLVDDGTISGWGWLAHHTGGQWQRIFYYQADSIDELLDAGAAVPGGRDSQANDANTDDAMSFNEICTRHDDYIWQVESGTIGADRGAAGFSVYHICDIDREDRADEIFDEHVAPILDQLIEDGELSSWAWSSHVVGGQFRKLQTMTAVDHKSLLKARGEAIDAIYGEKNEAGAEFSDICGPHVDYMWNIIHEK